MGTPAYSIGLGGFDITGNFNDRLLQLVLTENSGGQTDSVSIELDNRDFAISPPGTGEQLSLAIGYRETGLIFKGVFTVDAVKVSGPPHHMVITAKSADQKSAQKQHRTTKYEKKTLGDIIGEVASRNGLSAQVGGDLASIQIPYLHQTEESDWNLGTRLAHQFDAVSTIKNGMWIFTPRGGGESGGGFAMQTVTLVITDLIKYEASVNDRANHKEARGTWHDKSTGKTKTEKSDSGDTDGGQASFGIRHHHINKDIAKRSANAKAQELKRMEGSCSATITGDPSVTAEGIMVFATGNAVLDSTEWVVQSVSHHITPNEGYTTTISTQSKNGNKLKSTGTTDTRLLGSKLPPVNLGGHQPAQ